MKRLLTIGLLAALGCVPVGGRRQSSQTVVTAAPQTPPAETAEQPAETQPAEAQPEPAEAKPESETKPEPAETKPAEPETKPAQTAEAAKPAAPQCTVTIAASEGRRKVGDKTDFLVTVKDESGQLKRSGIAKVRLDNFGPKIVYELDVDLSKANPFTIRGGLREPGFLRLQVDVEGGTRGQGGLPLFWSVPYEPEKIAQGVPEPADFDAFWAKAIADLDHEAPGVVQCTPVPEASTDKIDYYLLSVQSYGRRSYGELSVPRKPGRYQAIVTVPGAGMKEWAFGAMRDEWRVRLTLPVFDFPPTFGDVKGNEAKAQASVQARLDKYGVNSYPKTGVTDSREAYFYYPVILGNLRIVKWLATQPFVDPKDIAYEGTSQGGGNGLFLLGLLPDVFARGRINVAAHVDMGGYKADRDSGWPSYDRDPALAPQLERAEKIYPYFDGANFAARVKCPVRFTVGYADPTCPPAAVWSAYNRLKVADRKIYECYGEDHYTAPWRPFGDELSNWVMNLK